MQLVRRTLSAAPGGPLLTSALAGCAEETELTEADRSQLSTGGLAGSSTTPENEMRTIPMDGIITVGADATVTVLE